MIEDHPEKKIYTVLVPFYFGILRSFDENISDYENDIVLFITKNYPTFIDNGAEDFYLWKFILMEDNVTLKYSTKIC